MSYKEEFPGFKLDVNIPEGFVDASWHNDVSPHWEKIKKFNGKEYIVSIWIWIYNNISEWDLPVYTRYSLSIEGESFGWLGEYNSNDWEDIVDLLETKSFKEIYDIVEDDTNEEINYRKKKFIDKWFKKLFKFVGLTNEVRYLGDIE